MKEHFVDEKTGISYTLVGDYYLPWGDLPDDEPEQELTGGSAICATLSSIRKRSMLISCSQAD